MTCEECGTALKPNARFCGTCGADVRDAAPVAAPTATPAGPLVTRGPFLTPRNIALLSAAAVVVAVLIAVVILVGNLRAIDTASGDGAGDGDSVVDSSIDDPDAGTGTDPDGAGTTDPVDAPVAIQLPDAAAVDPAFYAVPQWSDGVWFISPSTNLRCGIRDGFWGCAIAKKDWSGGDGIVADGSGIPSIVQGVAPEFPGGAQLETLPYGTSVSYGTVTCVSLEPHMICADTSTGHGFTISMNENDVY